MNKFLSIFVLLAFLPGLVTAQAGPGLGNLTYSNAELYNSIWDYTEINHMGSTMPTMVNGYLITTFHPDSGKPPGGILVWDVSDPRNPVLIKRVYDARTSSFREMHAVPQHGNYIIFQDGCGFQIWDFSNPRDPQQVIRHCMDGYAHDDYGSAWQISWQAPYIYIANGGAGFDVIDATDMRNPRKVKHIFTPRQVGTIQAVGNLLYTSAHDLGRGITLYDISNPLDPQLINSYSNTENMYASSMNGNRAVISARGNANNGLFSAYDISDPFNIKKMGSLDIGNRGEQLYNSSQDHFIFQGCQDEVVKIDASDPYNLKIVGRGHLVTGDVDHGQVTPFGNLIFVGNDHGSGSGFWVHQSAPDTKAPEVNMIVPRANSVNRALTSRIGITLTDNIMNESINTDNFIVRPIGGQKIDGKFSYAFSTINFSPAQPLQTNTTYEVYIPVGGIKDVVGNPIAEPFVSYFSTGPTGEFPPAKGNTPWVFEENGQVSLFWNNISNANSYIIKRGLSTTGPFEEIATTTGTFYTDSDVENDQYYYYTISGENSFGEGTTSGVTRAMPALYITDLDWVSASNEWGPVEKDQSNGENDPDDGDYISLNGQVYSRGVGVHANSTVRYNLSAGNYQRFTSDIGIDDEVGTGGSVIFTVLADGNELFNSGLMTGEDPTQTVDVDISGANTLTLTVLSDGDAGLDHASWGGARLRLPQRPYNGFAHVIPGKIEVEEYDLGGNNLAYYDATPGSQTGVEFRLNEDVDLENCSDVGGGYNLGWSTAGEWLEYTVDVKSAGTYDIELRVACNGDNRTLSLEMDDSPIANNIAVPNTSGWQEWQTVIIPDVTLKEGVQVMKLVVGDVDFVNVNYVVFTDIVTSVFEVQSQSVQAVPNPFNEEGFRLKAEGGYSYRICDISGKIISKGRAGGDIVLGQNLKKGLYILHVETDKTSSEFKMVKH